ncbi:MAG: tRNA (adenosine(37)-N6)-threonylcarbamoyltransferase complex transferase subunit TsaD [Deltaproteobacteria bacterium]|nr:tRNA (adenosine(37)-N6)-threonylcarbamoyltransferase complex transferase subunit TsaD [Deltaproteobacteria bacterium]
MLVLGIESSCDDTSAAVVEDGTRVRSCVVARQDEFHAKYGGVVPEIASRKHLEVIAAVVREAHARAGIEKSEIGGVAVSQGPGLVGSLIVGLNFAKAYAYAANLPFIGINHVEGHLWASRLGDRPAEPPFVGLVVSGGHTNLYLVDADRSMRLVGRTVDDAAGECFDKVAKMLGLGFPGGAMIDRLAAGGDPEGVDLPRPLIRSGDFRFSFSGLKTAVRTHLERRDMPPEGRDLGDLCASLNAAVVDVLLEKLQVAAREFGVGRVVIAGGVAANRMLRESAARRFEGAGIELSVPDFLFCTDNAAMIAAAGDSLLTAGVRSPWTANAYASIKKVSRDAAS